MLNFFKKVVYFESLDSTNDYLINLHKTCFVTEQLVVVARQQKKGRGRMGKKWFSDSGGLTFSISIELTHEITDWKMNMLISCALVEVFKKYGCSARIKYPNDIIINNKKNAGILIETISAQNKKYCIVGVGINVHDTLFIKNIENAISLEYVVKKKINQTTLLNSILLELSRLMINPKFIKKNYILQLMGSKDYITAIYQSLHQYVKILDISDRGVLTINIKDKGVFTINERDVKFLLH